MTDSYVCSCCGKKHDGVPFSFAASFPDPYANLSSAERDARAVASSDQCIIDQEQFFLRGCLEIPIKETEDVFLWGVWARVHERDFDQISANWESPGRERRTGPYKGRLSNSLSLYPETFNLKLTIHVRPVGERPLFVIEESDHPIAIEQRDGITLQRAEECACLLMRAAGLG